MNGNGQLRNAIIDHLKLHITGIKKWFDGRPTDIDLRSELPAIAVYIDSGDFDEQYVDSGQIQGPLTITVYLNAAESSDSDLDSVGQQIVDANDKVFDIGGATIDRKSFNYERDADNMLCTLSFVHTFNYWS